MKDEGKQTLTPKLRFPEFQEQTGWPEFSLEHLEDSGWLELGRGNVISAKDMQSDPGSFPVYSSSVRNDGYMGSYGQFMFDEELISWSVDGGGDFFHRSKHKFSVTNVSGYLRLKTDHLNYRFLAKQLQSLHAAYTFDYQFKAHPSVIRKLYRLGVPSPAEQQKIADCLTSLDEVIAAQGRKVEALAAHKKGLMQQLFPREGDTLPRLRFPEFRGEGEWKEKRLEEIADFQSGGTPSKSNPAFWNGTIPWVSAKDMKRMVLDDTEDHITDDAVEDGARVVPAGTVLILTRGMTLLKDIPICLLACPMALNQDVRALRPINGFDGLFLAYMLVGNKERIRIMVDIAGHGTGRLNTDRLKTLGLHFPVPAEQQRIAACLGSLDAALAAEAQALSALRTHKKGLMQQLFPAVGNGVTADLQPS